MTLLKPDFTHGVFAAPLAGITDAAQRELCVRGGADIVLTEMVSARGLLERGAASEELLRTVSHTVPTGVQLFGADPFVMKDAAMSPMLKDFDFIDINMGCPVPKVTKTGAGSALMAHIDRAATLVRVTSAAIAPRPLTVKFRLGYEDQNLNYVEFGQACQAAGAAAVTLHARTRSQGYGGIADWSAISALRSALSIPVIANGDIVDRDSYIRCLDATGCTSVMIGRAAMGRPWIFDEVKGQECRIDIPLYVRAHYQLLKSHYSERYTVLTMRHLVGCYLHGVAGASAARAKIYSAESIDEVFGILDAFFPMN